MGNDRHWIFVLLFQLFIVAPLLSFHQTDGSKVFHYYCTVSDETHFPVLLNLIGSIHKCDFENLDEISVFNIGLTQEQVEILDSIDRVKVLEIEKLHPDLFTYFLTHENGKTVRGWYAWKPIALKQALERYPYFLYLDAGSLVLSSLNDLFEYIQIHKYFLLDTPRHSIAKRITKSVNEKLITRFSKEQQDYILKDTSFLIVTGVLGISREMRDNFIYPMYDHASDLSLFADDGSCQLGFGAGRHDQTLFSIYAYALRLKVHPDGWTLLDLKGRMVPFHYHWDIKSIHNKTSVFSCRWEMGLSKGITDSIHWVISKDISKYILK